MKVKCLYNSGKDLKKQTLAQGYTNQSEMYLELNKSYNVYGICYDNGIFHYLVLSMHKQPDWYPSELFTIIDKRISYRWYFEKYDLDANPNRIIEAIWGYYELVKLENHFDDLANREDEALSTFMERKEQMDLEFSDDSITELAQFGDETWLICPTCIEPWEFTSCRDGMVRCPKCNNVMHNPRYKYDLPIV